VAEKIDFQLGVTKDGLTPALDRGIKKSKDLGGVLETALGVFAGNLITKGVDAVIGSFGDLISVAKRSINAAAEQEVAINNLNAALSRSGILTKETSKELVDFASSLQQTSTFGDEAILSITSLLATLTTLDSKGLKGATQSTLDLATALNIDLNTAALLVGKAANGNVSAFARYGIVIEQGTTKTETFANTLTALNSQFGGSANSKLNTYSGSVTSLNNAYGDLFEPIGDVVVKNTDFIASINTIKQLVVDLTKVISENNGTYQDLVSDGIFAAIVATELFADAMDGITVVAKALFNSLVAIKDAILLGMVEPFRLAYDAALLLIQNIPIIGKAFEGLQNPLDSLADSLRGNLIESINDIANSADSNIFRDLSEGTAAFGDQVIATSEKIKLANLEAETANAERKVIEDDANKEIIKQREQLNLDLLSLQSQLNADQKTIQEQLDVAALDEGFVKNEAAIQQIFDQKEREAQAVFDGEIRKSDLIKDGQNKVIAAQIASDKLRLAQGKATADKEIALLKLTNDTSLQERTTFLNTAASLSNSKSKELAAIGKTAAIANATIAGKEAIVSSFNYGSRIGGPPLGFTFAGIAAAATANQISQIAAVKFEKGGFVGGMNGASVGPDNTMAQVRTGEMILNANQQENLLKMLNNGGGGGGDIIIQVDSREIARAVRSQVQSGFKLGA